MCKKIAPSPFGIFMPFSLHKLPKYECERLFGQLNQLPILCKKLFDTVKFLVNTISYNYSTIKT